MNKKWKVRRGFIKMHIAVDVKSKKIDTKIDKVIADKAYDSNDNFNYLADKGIEPIIRVRSNSIVNGNSIRWKYKHDYGKRWIAESVFSSFKRIFGEYVKSVKWNNIIKELMIKASAYNLFIKISNGYG